MTEDKHMQKAREIVQELIAHSSSTLFAEDIATALSEAYRAGVEEERARCAGIANSHNRWADDDFLEPDAAVGRNVTAMEIFAAIRKP